LIQATATGQKRAFGYLRVSDAKQTGERHSSLETQRLVTATIANGMVLVPQLPFWTLRLDAGMIVKNTRAWSRCARRGEVDVIVVQFLDSSAVIPRDTAALLGATGVRVSRGYR